MVKAHLQFGVYFCTIVTLVHILQAELVQEPFIKLHYEESTQKLYLSSSHLYLLEVKSSSSPCTRLTQLTVSSGGYFTILENQHHDIAYFIDSYNTQKLYQQKVNKDNSLLDCFSSKISMDLSLQYITSYKSSHVFAIISNPMHYNNSIVKINLAEDSYTTIIQSPCYILQAVQVFKNRLFWFQEICANPGFYSSNLDGSDAKPVGVQFSDTSKLREFVFVNTFTFSETTNKLYTNNIRYLFECTIDEFMNFTNCTPIFEAIYSIKSIAVVNDRLYWIESDSYNPACSLVYSSNLQGINIEPVIQNNDTWFTCKFDPIFNYTSNTFCFSEYKQCTVGVDTIIIGAVSGAIIILILVVIGYIGARINSASAKKEKAFLLSKKETEENIN